MRAALLAATAVASAGGAQAQNFPSRPIALVVPSAAGGSVDLTARRLAVVLGEQLGTTVVVENRVGAGFTVAAGYVARAPKDGYTLLFASSSTWAINPYLFKELPYKLDDFAPVSLVSKQTIVMTATPTLPAKTIPEFVAFGKSRPQGVTYGTSGTGSLTNIVGEWIGRVLGVKMVEVPYKGQSAAVADLVTGRIDLQMEGITSAAPMHNAGKTRVLAVMAETRSPLIPDVPTFKEMGYPELVVHTTFGVLAPSDTPEPVINTLHRAIAKVVNSPEFASKLAVTGETAEASTDPRQYRAFVREEYEKWGRIIKPMNLTPN